MVECVEGELCHSVLTRLLNRKTGLGHVSSE